MNSDTLIELADKWERDNVESGHKPVTFSDDDQGHKQEGYELGRREQKRECGDAIRMLVRLLG